MRVLQTPVSLRCIDRHEHHSDNPRLQPASRSGGSDWNTKASAKPTASANTGERKSITASSPGCRIVGNVIKQGTCCLERIWVLVGESLNFGGGTLRATSSRRLVEAIADFVWRVPNARLNGVKPRWYPGAISEFGHRRLTSLVQKRRKRCEGMRDQKLGCAWSGFTWPIGSRHWSTSASDLGPDHGRGFCGTSRCPLSRSVTGRAALRLTAPSP
jgi:hypothetical protein